MFCLCVFSSTFSIDGRSRSSRGLRWRSWTALGAYVGSPGRSWGLCWRSWAALKAYVGGLGSRSGPMWAVLGADQGLSWRSWPVLGPKRSVLEGDQGEKWPKPKRERRSGQETVRPKPPNDSLLFLLFVLFDGLPCIRDSLLFFAMTRRR